ncbi:DUF5018 domain-containing protein [Flavobacterium sp. JAS]|uniref:DUF5018 domain-containing protein n=1 Tax=Flavobacterium sp. JAS TaxID=2897329 RepID=UPI001E61C444|nr:DUF5018 domain-containing protein [Flavobacterium sp. JAS]MCD0470158.1 DUF5018 domain-containing protein [Flavobacterium sp. JAS]
MKTKIYRFATFLIASLLMISCVSEEIKVPASKKNEILSFVIKKGDISKPLDILENTISGTVDSSFDLNDITLEVLISDGATISPDPASIKSINGPLTFVVTAVNGKERTYNVLVSKTQSSDNSILEFNITTPYFLTSAKIDQQTGSITKRLPSFVDLANLSVDLKYADNATISPDPKTITDYSSPVDFIVKSESGIEKTYQVKLEHMNINMSESCTDSNANKWFGGDNRTDAPDILPFDRNIGTGQTVLLSKDLTPSVFSIHLLEGFAYAQTYDPYRGDVILKLIIRDEKQKIIASTETTVPGNFNGGFVPFDLQNLHLFLEAGKEYVFYWYLVDGAALGIMSGSSANKSSGSGFCFQTGYSGSSKVSTGTTLEDLSVWYKHTWHFNMQLEGKE